MACHSYTDGMNIRRLVVSLAKNQSGATAIELGFLVALIAVAMITSLNVFSNSLKNTLMICANHIASSHQ